MEIDEQKRQQALSRGVTLGFVPKRLEIKGLPQFDYFPFNIMFSSMTVRDGARVAGSTLYEPEFHTLRKEGSMHIMRYRNIHGGDWFVTITYDEEQQRYHGEKFAGEKQVGSADGRDDWQMFFVHLTMLGLSNGEMCEFESS